MMKLATCIVSALSIFFISNAHAESVNSSPMMDRASKTFSEHAFDTPKTKIAKDLTVLKEHDCEKRRECDYLDSNQVGHYFFFMETFEDSLLVVKSIDTKRFEDRPIPAFGIGLRREKSQTLRVVSQFLDGKEPHCYQQNEHGLGLACEFYIGDGWTKLFFDTNEQLIFIRLDAYHFT